MKTMSWGQRHLQIGTCLASNLSSDKVILDTGSSFSIFKDEQLVGDVCEATVPMRMQTNAGTRICDLQATVPGLGTVWFNKNAIANIFSFGQLEGHQIFYDSDLEDAFYVTHRESGHVC